jgi:GDPmannose 4,6-dehydratase
MPTALITGISGQDGWYLARQLMAEGHRVVGLGRDAVAAARAFDSWDNPPEIQGFDYTVPGAATAVIEAVRPDWVFNLASFATGQGMFDQPQAMARLNGMFVLDLLEAIRNSPRREAITLVQASSSEMFGDVREMPQDEDTPLRPKSPYGAAKQYAHSMVGIYRRAFGVRACSAILYNHESIRRPPAFVTKKIARTAARISLGLETELVLGALDISRDWGYAPEYMDALARMARASEPCDYVVATGRLTSIREVVQMAFDQVGLEWEHYVRLDTSWTRPVESVGLCGNPVRIVRDLGWRATTPVSDIIAEMVTHERAAAEPAAA